jgi:hypothetical protein
MTPVEARARETREWLDKAGEDLASARFHEYRRVFRGNRSLTVAAPIRAPRVSKRCFDTLANFRNGVLSLG